MLFIQDCGTYSNEILVGIGVNKKEVLVFAKKKRFKKDVIKWIEEDEDIFKIKELNKGLFCYNDKAGCSILLLNPYSECWDYWETLIHEISHIVHKITKDKMMLHEDEAKAYLSDFLFRKIRRKIQGVDSIKER